MKKEDYLPSNGVFNVVVCYGDPKWTRIDLSQYFYVDPDVSIEHFPIEPNGEIPISLEYVVPTLPYTTQDILNIINQRGLRPPNRAEVESFLDQYPNECKQKNFIFGLCGTIVEHEGDNAIALVGIAWPRRGIRIYPLGHQWTKQCYFLAVHK